MVCLRRSVHRVLANGLLALVYLFMELVDLPDQTNHFVLSDFVGSRGVAVASSDPELRRRMASKDRAKDCEHCRGFGSSSFPAS